MFAALSFSLLLFSFTGYATHSTSLTEETADGEAAVFPNGTSGYNYSSDYSDTQAFNDSNYEQINRFNSEIIWDYYFDSLYNETPPAKIEVLANARCTSEPETAEAQMERMPSSGAVIGKVWGDGYYVRDLFNFCQRNGIKTAVKIRRDTSPKAHGSMRKAHGSMRKAGGLLTYDIEEGPLVAYHPRPAPSELLSFLSGYKT